MSFAAAVAVEERGDGAVGGEVGDRVGDVGPLDGDCVLDATFEQGQHVRAPFDDDDGVGVADARAGGKPFIVDDSFDTGGLADLV